MKALLWVAAFAAEFWLFDQVGAHRYTGIYARWNDQVQYLTEAYAGWIAIKGGGWAAGLWSALTTPRAQGALHAFLADLFFLAAGRPSRSAALAVNMAAFLVWQGAWARAVWSRTGRMPLAAAAAALPLALAGPWRDQAGAAYDFRLDHLALCGMGTVLACAFASDGFRRGGWSAAAGAALGATVAARFITAAYLAPILAVLLLLAASGPGRGPRLRHGALAALIAAALAGPWLWIDRAPIWSYYAIGHTTGPEAAVRDAHLALWPSLRWIAATVAGRHLGPAFGGIALAGIALLAAGALAARRAAKPPGSGREAADLLFLGLLFALIPALVLAQHPLKSEVVVGICVPGVLALVLAAWTALAARAAPPWAAAAAAAAILGGAASFLRAETAATYAPAFAAEARRVNALADAVYRRSRQAGLAAPRIGVDHITDSLDAQALRLICFERHGAMPAFFMTLPIGIVAEPEDLLFRRVAESDFFFFTAAGPVGPWPYDREMRGLAPRVGAWCEKNLRPAERFALSGRTMILYQARNIPLD